MTVPDSKHTNNIVVGDVKVTVHGENHSELKESPALCSWDSSCLLYAMIPVTNEHDGGGTCNHLGISPVDGVTCIKCMLCYRKSDLIYVLKCSAVFL